MAYCLLSMLISKALNIDVISGGSTGGQMRLFPPNEVLPPPLAPPPTFFDDYA